MAGKLGALVCFHKNTKKYKKKLWKNCQKKQKT
jgi:hypothetical protein